MFAALVIALPFVVARHGAPTHSHSASLSTPHALGFLQKADSCECSYHGTCSCQGALEFMTCIKNSCESDDCRCVVNDRRHFQEACQNMAAGCPDLGLMCADEEATCDGETIGWIPTDDFVRFHGNDKQSQDLYPEVSQDNLPDGWEKAWSDEEGRYYYANRETGESSWTPPPTSANDDRTMVSQGSARTTDISGQSKATPIEPGEKHLDVGGVTYVTLQWHNHEVKDLKRREHHNYAKGTIAGIMGLSITIALMSSKNPTIVKNTWTTLNFTICVFLALLWYYVGLDYFTQNHIDKWAKVILEALYGIVLLLVSSVLTWAVERKYGSKDATIFNSIYDHILVWWFCGVANAFQLQFQHSAIQVFLAMCVLAMFFAALAFIWHSVVAKFTTRFGSAHSIDFLTGTALASSLVDWVHLLFTGVWHKVGYHDPKKKTIATQMLMACSSLVWILVALKAVPVVKRMSDGCVNQNGEAKPNMYWKMRALATLGIFVNWLPHFSCVLNLGNFVIGACGFNANSVDGHLYITIVSCCIGIGLIALCTKVTVIREETSLSNVLIGLAAFMVGTSLAGGINNSISMALEGYTKTFQWRLLITCSLSVVVFPVYFFCFKPLFDQKFGAK